MVTFLFGVAVFVIGVAIGIVAGSKITAEIKAGFELLSQTIHARITSLEASIKSKV